MLQEDTPSTLQFCLVQRLAPGKSLAQLIAEGKRFSQDQVIDIMLQVRPQLVASEQSLSWA